MSARYWEEDALPVLSDYVRIRCLSPEFDAEWEQHGEIAKAARLLADWASQRKIADMTVGIEALPGLTPVVIADIPATDGRAGRPTLMYGHLDKQPPLGNWRSGLDPFEPVREDDRLYGRGTADDGYSIFAALGAIELLERVGLPHGRCVVIIEASEESGSPHLAPYLEAVADRIGAEGPGLVVALDSGALDYDRLWYTTSLRGLVAATVTVKVLEEGIHSGGGGGVVPDSFRLLRQLLSRIEDERSGEVLLPSCSVTVPAVRRSEADALVSELGPGALDHFPTVGTLRAGGDRSPLDAVLARTWRASVAAVGMDGFPPVADGGNVIRAHTSMKLAMRIPPSADPQAVASELASTLLTDPPEGALVEVTDVIPAKGFDAPVSAEWLRTSLEGASTRHFGAPARGMGEGGTIPFLAELLSSCPDSQYLVTGVLGPRSNAHGPNEMLHLPTAVKVTAAVAEVLTDAP